MNYIEKYWKHASLTLGAFVVAGLILSFVNTKAAGKEKAAQDAFVSIQSDFEKYKEQMNPQKVVDPAKANEKPVDLNALKSNLEKFINENPGLVATQVAGLSLSEILLNENKPDEALTLLNKVITKESVLTNILVQKTIGQILADTGKCQEAISFWNQIIDNKKAEFAHNDTKIKQALCYQQLNQADKAESLLTTIINNKTAGNEQMTQDAEKILRLIKFNKSSGS